MNNVIYKGQGYELEWPDVWETLGLSSVKKKTFMGESYTQWYIKHETLPCVVEFLAEFGICKGDYMSSSKVATLLLNRGFAKYLVDQEPQLALKLHVGIEVEL